MALAVLAMSPAAVASAAPSSLEFSVDGGASWMSAPPSTVFDPAFRFVPGDVLSHTLLFRSTRPEPTAVIVTLGAHSVSEALLAEALSLSAADDDGNGISATRLSSLRECEPLVPVRVVQQNEPMAITLSIAVSTTLANRDAQSSISTSTITIGLTDPENTAALAGCLPDAAAVPPAAIPTVVIPVSGPDATVPDAVESALPADQSSAEQGSGLASTGFARLQQTLIAAGAAVTAGGLLLLIARRRRRGRA
jgi:hypothetical protein